tara:strand:+ start:447 stop:1145 length:699 start_codon:yes stop_codon:yes gene_type:complete
VKSWIEYWEKEQITSDNIWKKGNRLFFNNSLKFIEYKPSDVIMDFGSGKGFFSELLIKKVKEIHLVETSKNCIKICKKKFTNYDHISYHILPPENYLNFDFTNTKFNKIFVISVVHYFNSYSDLKVLIEKCKNIIIPNNGQMIIADIPIEKNIFKDITNIIYSSILINTFLDTLILIFKSFFGNYRRTRENKKIKIFNLKDLKEMLEGMHLDYKIIKGITSVKNRITIFINF